MCAGHHREGLQRGCHPTRRGDDAAATGREGRVKRRNQKLQQLVTTLFRDDRDLISMHRDPLAARSLPRRRLYKGGKRLQTLAARTKSAGGTSAASCPLSRAFVSASSSARRSRFIKMSSPSARRRSTSSCSFWLRRLTLVLAVLALSQLHHHLSE